MEPEYITYTSEVKSIIAKTHKYPFIDFELRVDGTGYLIAMLISGAYYQQQFSCEEMKLPADSMAKLIIRSIEK